MKPCRLMMPIFRRRTNNLDLLEKMLGKSEPKIFFPNGGGSNMVIYHGRIHKQSPLLVINGGYSPYK